MATMQRKEMDWEEIWNHNEYIIQFFLKYWGQKDLLVLSLLNKTWNYEARSLLKHRGKIVAKIGQNVMEPLQNSPAIVFEVSNTASTSTTGPQFRVNTSHISGLKGKILHSVRSRWAIRSKFGPANIISNEIPRPLRLSSDTAHVSGTTEACHDVVNFTRMLSEMTGVVPFVGMNICMDLAHEGTCAIACQESLVNEIGTRFPLKTIHLGLKRSGRNREGTCRAERLIGPLFRDYTFQLEEMSLDIRHPTSALEAVFTDCQFPHLHVLKSNNFSSRRTILGSIVRGAPNLKEIHVIGLQNPMANQDAVTSHLERFLQDVVGQSPAILVCPRSVSHSPQLPSAHLNKIAYSSVGMNESFWDSPSGDIETNTILWNSQNTLKDAELNFLQLANVLKNGARMEKLDTLTVHFFEGWDKAYPKMMSAVLRQEAWRRCFPNLKTLNFYETYHALLHSTQADKLLDALGNVSCRAPGDKAPLWLTQLNLPSTNTYSVSTNELKLLLEVCQNSKFLSLLDLDVSLTSDRTPSLPYLMSRLSCLENVESNGLCDGGSISKFDALFCGVHEDEAEEWRRKSVEYLNAVHIVPIQTPMTYLKRLKKLVLHERAGPATAGRTFVISEVSAALCFSRMPDLTIELNSPASFPYGPTKTQRVFLDIMKKFPEIKMITKQFIIN